MRSHLGRCIVPLTSALWLTCLAACGSGGNGGGFDGGLEDAGKHHGGSPDGGIHLGGGDGGPNVATCEAGCPLGTSCNHGVCEPHQPDCVSNSGCEDDTYCEGNHCVPYGSAPSHRKSDPGCQSVAPAGVFAPKVFCEFSQAPAGDAFPQHLDVQATPIVVNFDGKGGIPSIIAPFTANVPNSYTENMGIVRILSGKDCSLVANLGGVDLNGDGTIDWVHSPSAVAVGDLDGDKVAEIVVYMADNTTVAFTRRKGAWVPFWPKVVATLADGVTPFTSTQDEWSGPSIHDLDDDGVPEIVRGDASVIDGKTGKLRASGPSDWATYSVGLPPVLADVYSDGKVELTNGANVWRFDGTLNAWVDVATYSQVTPSSPGWAAVADMNPYDGKHQPEIAVATGGALTIYSLDHSVFMNMDVTVPIVPPSTTGGGGPPTIADFDNDGLPEVGLAGADSYTVFDPDCQATPRKGGKCASRNHCDSFPGGACPDYILWSRLTQDHSSNITGSSVFDFAGDGHPQVVYADECFARAFSGEDGTVVFSQYHSSCTWIENPVVADVDGDFRAELVVPSNLACGMPPDGIPCVQLDANLVDADFPGAACQTNADCSSNQCDMGLCRCAATADCCPSATDAACLEAGYQCSPPPTGTPGTGNTCRAPHPHGLQGIRVFKDAKDRWVRSREIWNQHAYAVTNVNDDGTIPKTSSWAENWTTGGLNNFRQNVPGTPNGKAIGDLTAKAGTYFTCTGGGAVFEEPICNRGTAPIGAGVPVGFYVGKMKVCSATTATPLDVGDCETVSCTWSSPPTTAGAAANVTVVANDGDTKTECDTSNDLGLVTDVYCAGAK